MFKKLFDSGYKELKRCEKIAKQVFSYEDEMAKLSDDELKAKTPYFKDLLKNGKTLDDILPEAYAVVREAAYRVIQKKPFFVQVCGAIAIHGGNIAEMKTGEGKTLTAVMPAYLNALSGNGVHIVTVNEYLAQREVDGEIGTVYRWLGLTVGLNIRDLSRQEKRDQYACDILYSTNSELGFDYLRDNMAVREEDLVQVRGLNYAIIDEVDSILIDEARTPLIISGGAKTSAVSYQAADSFVKSLSNEDYEIDIESKTIQLLESGVNKAEKQFNLKNLYELENVSLVHRINNALKANYIFTNGVEYMVQDGEVVIIDSFTGRVLKGRQYSEGLHQALEAKEGVEIKQETVTVATITYQNFFRMYKKLSGMTGTAKTEEEEFRNIYNMYVVEVPTNKPVIRKDMPDLLYCSMEAKINALVEEIKARHATGQPILVGTVSVESSEVISKRLTHEGIPHEVLNAKYHEKEAQIIAQAGKFGAVTIATNMAGRGTDIMLGGNSEYLAKQEMRKLKYTDEEIEDAAAHNETDDKAILAAREKFNELEKKFDNEIKEEKEKVIEAGGLKIIGTQRHESRRIDNQLRGRSGRQGDPGESRFYIGLDDDLMKIFGGDIVTKVYNTLGADEDMPIESRLISKAVENAQKKVEGRNFSIRKNVLQYDDVMNVQRTVIYEQRRDVLDGMNLKESILKMMDSVVELIVDSHIVDGEEVNKESIAQDIETNLGISDVAALKTEKFDRNALVDELIAKVHEIYASKETEFGEENLRELERVVMLKIVDQKWMDHIDNMDELKKGIGLRGYGQQDPVVQYRLEGTEMFDDMIEDIRMDVVKILLNIRKKEGPIERTETTKVTGASLEDTAINLVDGNISEKEGGMNKTVVNEGPKVGRNDPCPCGSGKKYKNCCGKNA